MSDMTTYPIAPDLALDIDSAAVAAVLGVAVAEVLSLKRTGFSPL